MLTLGIETSCDETGAAVLEGRNRLRSSTVASQDELHGRFGGIVPELASRCHIAMILPMIDAALEKAGVSLNEIDGIAVTHGPGLVGSLLVGVSVAKAIGFARKIPFVGVHHVEGHLASIFLGEKEPIFPIVGLVASGGHTSLYHMEQPGSVRLLGETLDDAAGEAFDKVARLLGLPFPGGPSIDRAAKDGDPSAISFPRPSMDQFDFSFSGLKTSVAQWVTKHGVPKGESLCDLAASFQEAVVDVLMAKLFEAAEYQEVNQIAVCGGVAQNRRLRQRVQEEMERRDFELYLTPSNFCTDNAAMIAVAGQARLAAGQSDDLNLNAEATIPFAIS